MGLAKIGRRKSPPRLYPTPFLRPSMYSLDQPAGMPSPYGAMRHHSNVDPRRDCERGGRSGHRTATPIEASRGVSDVFRSNPH